VLPSDRVRNGGSGQRGGSSQWGGPYRNDQGPNGQGWQGQGWSGPAWSGPGGRGDGPRGGRRSGSILGVIPLFLTVWCAIVVLSALAFGIGSGPSIVVIFLGVLAVLRKLFGFGRRRGMPGPRPRRRGRRW
jgi:hypothetical protein